MSKAKCGPPNSHHDLQCKFGFAKRIGARHSLTTEQAALAAVNGFTSHYNARYKNTQLQNDDQLFCSDMCFENIVYVNLNFEKHNFT